MTAARIEAMRAGGTEGWGWGGVAAGAVPAASYPPLGALHVGRQPVERALVVLEDGDVAIGGDLVGEPRRERCGRLEEDVRVCLRVEGGLERLEVEQAPAD